MKKISVQSRDRMIRALKYALGQVRIGEVAGLCYGICIANGISVITDSEEDYLKLWISKMIQVQNVYLEYPKSAYDFTPEERYQHRKPWVEWMIQHLKETT